MCCAPSNLDRNSLTDVNLENLFVAVAKGGDPKGDGRSVAQAPLEQWLTKAAVLDDKTISKADVAAAFQKQGKAAITFADFSKMLADLAASRKVDLHALKEKLLKVPAPK